MNCIWKLYSKSFHFHREIPPRNNTFDPSWITRRNKSYVLIDNAPLINDIHSNMWYFRSVEFLLDSLDNYFKDILNYSYVNSIIAFLRHFHLRSFPPIFQSYFRRTLIKFFRHPLLSFHLMRINNYTEWSHYFWQRLQTRDCSIILLYSQEE